MKKVKNKKMKGYQGGVLRGQQEGFQQQQVQQQQRQQQRAPNRKEAMGLQEPYENQQ